MNKYINKNNIVKYFKTISFVLVFFACTLSSFSKVYAKTYKYVITTLSGETYTILADVEAGNVKVLGSLNNIKSGTSGNFLSGSSYYNVIAYDYEECYNNQKNTTSEILKSRAADLNNLLIMLVVGQNYGENPGYSVIDYNNTTIIKAEGSTFKWGDYIKSGVFGTDLTSYRNIIFDNVDKRTEKNPYYVDNAKRNSDNITINKIKLSNFYTDEELIHAYELIPENIKKDITYISKTETNEESLFSEGYKLELESVTSNDGSSKKSLLLKVINTSNNNVVERFIVAQTDSKGTLREVAYKNGEGSIGVYNKNGFLGVALTDKKDLSTKMDSSKLLYYSYGTGNETLSKYKNGERINYDNGGVIFAIRNVQLNSVDVYVQRNADVSANIIGSFTILNSPDFGFANSLEVTSNEWVIKKDKNIIKVYKSNETNIDDNAFFLSLDKAFIVYNDNKNYYDIVIPTKKGITSFYTYEVDGNKEAYYTFIRSDRQIKKEYETNAPAVIFENDLKDGNVSMTMQTYKMVGKIPKYGSSKDDVLIISSLKSNNDDSSLPPELPFKDFAGSVKNSEIISSIKDSANEKGLTLAQLNVIREDEFITVEFLAQLVGYGKIVLILVIFISILIAGFRHILEGTSDPKARAKTIEAMKNILYGVLIFISLALIVALVEHYLDEGFEFMKGVEGTEIIQDDYDESIRSSSLILDLIEVILKVVNEITAGLIEIFMKTVSGSHEGVDYIKLIYDVYDDNGNVSDMLPFDENGVEWTRILSGYNALTSIAFFMLLIAIVKISFEYIIDAGDEKKLVKVKETWFRIFWAIILIVAVPYLVRLLLYFFNYMTAIVPVNVSADRFNIQINYNGVLGAIGQNIFLTAKFEIYFAFFVRHVMMDVLIVSAPIIIAAWAISEKFKSFPMWFGELFTNIAMQFCYAVGFLVIIFLSYDNSNPVYSLLLITVAMSLSKFIKDSLQGYFQNGAGINEESEGKQLSNRLFGWGRKTKRYFKKAGNLAEGFSRKLDPNQETKVGKAVSKAGFIMQGKFGKVHISSTKYSNERKMHDALRKIEGKEEYDDVKAYADQYKIMFDKSKSEEERAQAKAEFVRQSGGVYDIINEYYDDMEASNKGLGGRWALAKDRTESKILEHQLEKRGLSKADHRNIEHTGYLPMGSSKEEKENYNKALEEGKVYLTPEARGARTNAFNDLLDIRYDKDRNDELEMACDDATSVADAILQTATGELEAAEEMRDAAIRVGVCDVGASKKLLALESAEQAVKELILADAVVLNNEKKLVVQNLAGRLIEKNEQKINSANIDINSEGLKQLFEDELKKAYDAAKKNKLPTIIPIKTKNIDEPKNKQN